MALSNDLLSQFAKVTKSADAPKKETTAYGTITKRGDSIYVKLDGSDLLTPVSTTTNVVEGERVTVLIKNHIATVTGNISSPAARTQEVEEVRSNVGALEETHSELSVKAEGISSSVSSIQTTVENNEKKINIANTLITQLSDMISTLVQDENGTSLMTQTSTGWSFDLSTITNTLKSHADSIANFDDHIKFSTFEGEPCIELCETSTDFKVLITNKRFLFQEGSAIPTYIFDNTLVTENINVKKSFQQGGFVWKIRPNGNLALVWKEASE